MSVEREIIAPSGVLLTVSTTSKAVDVQHNLVLRVDCILT